MLDVERDDDRRNGPGALDVADGGAISARAHRGWW